MKIVIALVIFVMLLIGVSSLFVYSGVYNVAATAPHTDVVEWMLNTAMERSVKSRAGGVKVPQLDDESMISVGLRSYDEMCATCHGAPGVSKSVIGEGLYPEPPDLAEESEEFSPEELFWIVKNGIKDTGMPAFGPTHKDGELWEVVAFNAKTPCHVPGGVREDEGKNKRGRRRTRS